MDGDDSYMPVFLVGAGTGRSLAAALRVPFFATTHQRGHLRAARVETGLPEGDFLALHLSGGTTDVLAVRYRRGRLWKSWPRAGLPGAWCRRW